MKACLRWYRFPFSPAFLAYFQIISSHLALSTAPPCIPQKESDTKIREAQPRKLAEHSSEVPIWALDYQAIIIPGSPVKVYKLDEGKSFPLTLPNGQILDGRRMQGYLWSSSNRFLSMVEYGCFDALYGWVAELSEDLSKAVNFTIGVRGFDY